MVPIGFFSDKVGGVLAGVALAPVPLELRTQCWGRSGSARVLLVHGVQSSANSWWQVADALARAGVHVTAPDLRGHGHSPSGRSYRLDDFVADLVGLGDRWQLAVGHSLGGTLIARALALDPGFARQAVLLDPVLELPEEEFDAVVAGQLAELAAADAVALQAANPAWHPEDCRIKALAAAACSPYVSEAVLRENRPWDYRDLVAGTRTPVLVLGADPGCGGMLDPSLAQRLADSNPRIGYRQLAGVGHSIHRDRPQLVIEALLEVL